MIFKGKKIRTQVLRNTDHWSNSLPLKSQPEQKLAAHLVEELQLIGETHLPATNVLQLSFVRHQPGLGRVPFLAVPLKLRNFFSKRALLRPDAGFQVRDLLLQGLAESFGL